MNKILILQLDSVTFFQVEADADHGITIIQSNEVESTVEEQQARTAILQTHLRTNLLVSVVLE